MAQTAPTAGNHPVIRDHDSAGGSYLYRGIRIERDDRNRGYDGHWTVRGRPTALGNVRVVAQKRSILLQRIDDILDVPAQPVPAKSVLILQRAQAQAVHSAMRMLNELNGKVDVTFGDPDNGVHVFEYKWGITGAARIYVHSMRHGVVIDNECYDKQSNFAKAYELGTDA